MTSSDSAQWLPSMVSDGRTVDSAEVESGAPGNGATRLPKDATDSLIDGARLQQEYETLRSLSAARVFEMENLSRRKDALIAIASHDLKTPLTSILGYAQFAALLLASNAPNLDKVKHALAVIEDQGRAMTRLIEALLDASSIQLGGLRLRPTLGDIDDNLRAVVARMGPDKGKRIDITFPRTRVVGRWDQDRIEQVLTNLVENALKYSPDDTRVAIEVTRRDTAIEIAVSDHGIGIPADELMQAEGAETVPLFERFHRTPQAHASGAPGAGLGLYICRGIVAAHGGRLWAESPGLHLGSTFRFTVPDQVPAG